MQMKAQGRAPAPATRAPGAARPEAATGPAVLPARTGRQRPGPATRDRSLILGPIMKSASTARGTVNEALKAWGLGHLTETAELITSELTANAVSASVTAAPPGTEPRPVMLRLAA